MTTTASKITIAAEPILASDLGKYKSVACLSGRSSPAGLRRTMQSEVTLTKGFWMAKHETTQEQWQRPCRRRGTDRRSAKRV